MKLINVETLLYEIETLNLAGSYEKNEHSKKAYQEIKQAVLKAQEIYNNTFPLGYWISDIVNAKCSCCGGRGSNAYKYCPHCGASME